MSAPTTRPRRTRAAALVSALVLAIGMLGALGAPAAAEPGELVVNGGFEDGPAGWEFVGGSGVATNNPHTGARFAYLDSGSGNAVSQQIAVPDTGSYTATAWIAASGNGGAFGIRRQDGEVLASRDVAKQTSYRQFTLPPVGLEAGTTLEVYVSGGSGWRNIDDISVVRDPRTLFGFEVEGQQGTAEVDHETRTVRFQLPYTSDFTGLVGSADLPLGSTISPDPAQPRDYTEQVTFEVTDATGSTVDWTVIGVEEAKTVTIASDHQPLVDAVNWAKWRARGHVQTGQSGPINVNGGTPGETVVDYIPSYWAGYAHRTAFYSRDYVHQVPGAHLLGLEEENKSMLRAFAETANESRKWYPLWALNFDGSPYTIDYRSDTNFVREVPAVFELVQSAEDQYRWTGDTGYLTDEVLWRYYTKAVTEFIELHDAQLPNGVAEGTGRGIFQGAASYNERGDHAIIEAGDGIASQYRALSAYAELASARGEQETAAEFAAKAEELQRYFAEEWGVSRAAWEYVRGHGPAGETYTGFGRENSVFLALKEILDPDDKRTWDFVDYLDVMYDKDRPPNIEATTYVPDALFRYGRDEQAWAWMEDIVAQLHLPHEVRTQGVNGDYPETSFTLVSQAVEGLAGVRPDAPRNAVSVRSHLPGEIGWLDLDHIQVGEHDLGVRHEGRTSTTVRHNDGSAPLAVTVQLPGGYPKLQVNGKVTTPEHIHINGRALSEVTVVVPVGESVTVTTVGNPNPVRHGDTILTHPDDFELVSPAADATGIPSGKAEFAWTESPNAREYLVTVASDEAMTEVVAEARVRGTEAVVRELPAGARLYWEVTAINTDTGQRLVVPAGERSFRTLPTAAPEAPQDVVAHRVGDRVGIAWDAPEQTLFSTVYRAPAGSEQFEVLAAEITGTSYVDRDAADGPYTYRVTGSNEVGESAGTVVEESPLPADTPVEYLSDREWVSATSGWRSVNRDLAVSGNPLRIDGTTYAKGIGTHATSEIVFDLDPADAVFRAVVGIDDVQRTSPNTSIGFRVLADGDVVFDSGTMRAEPYSTPQLVEVDVLGVERLVLEVTDGGDGINSDHADWAEARIAQLR
jgi:hypothetical protein